GRGLPDVPERAGAHQADADERLESAVGVRRDGWRAEELRRGCAQTRPRVPAVASGRLPDVVELGTGRARRFGEDLQPPIGVDADHWCAAAEVAAQRCPPVPASHALLLTTVAGAEATTRRGPVVAILSDPYFEA